MKKGCDKYRDEILSAYVDEELPCEKRLLIKNHISTCSYCSSRIKFYEKLRNDLSGSIMKAAADENYAEMEHAVMERIAPKGFQNFRRWFTREGSGRMYLQAAGIVVIILAVFGLYQGGTPGDLGPSAIVNSVDGEVAQVMIFEATESHTVIWYSET